jgi:glycosidase
MYFRLNNVLILILFLVMSTNCNNSSALKEKKKVHNVPEWSKHVIWYQIFPERFNNGDPSNDPNAKRIAGDKQLPENWVISPWIGDWYERADWEHELGPNFRDAVFYRRYGGDIQGIIDKLDYLQELGIGAIYLNPVFDAVSLHKYDTSNYRHVDRFFGPDPEGDAAIMEQEDPMNPATWQWTSADILFLELIKQVHERGMKIIIDGVFNHTGTDFWAFKDLKQKQEDSNYKKWYDVIAFDDPGTPEVSEFDYNGWWGVRDLPELREVDGNLIKPVRTHIANITRRWMDPDGDGDPSDGVDGWRLDVPEEIGKPFWEQWCGLVRKINPEAYIVGEIWDEKAQGWVNDSLFTAVMNYQFAKAVQDYMIDRDITAVEFADRLRKVRESFPGEANYVVQNLMDSHDTPRLASMILNPGREYDTLGKPEEGFNVRRPNKTERKLQRLIALFQFTYIGAPMIYYGTEAGMWGADDPDNRKPMVWSDKEYEVEGTHPLDVKRPADENRFDNELFEWYKKLAEIRNEHEIFQTGQFLQLVAEPEKNIYSFARHLGDQDIGIVVLNNSEDQQQIEIHLSDFNFANDKLEDLITKQKYGIEDEILKLTIEPISGMIFLAE